MHREALFIKRQIPFRANLKPVMVWIYGGAWYVGTSDMYPGYNLALNGDVVVVSYNYRLNVSVTVLNNWKLLLQTQVRETPHQKIAKARKVFGDLQFDLLFIRQLTV